MQMQCQKMLRACNCIDRALNAYKGVVPVTQQVLLQHDTKPY
jgi:hypothetical protein